MSRAMGTTQTRLDQGKSRARERDEENTENAERHRRFGQSGRDQKGSPPFPWMSGMETGQKPETQKLYRDTGCNEHDAGQRRRKEDECRQDNHPSSQ